MIKRSVAPSKAKEILELVSIRTGLPYWEIMSQSRRSELVRARRMIYRQLRDLGASYPQIGLLMRRDHSTVMHALKAA